MLVNEVEIIIGGEEDELAALDFEDEFEDESGEVFSGIFSESELSWDTGFDEYFQIILGEG